MSSRASILIVEDEEVIAIDLQDTLQENGYEIVGWASTGEDAIAMCREELPDLVLMDINLEGEMDGVEAASVIRSTTQTPVIFLTTLVDDETFARAKITEPQGYVVKPFRIFELNSAIELALLRSRSNLPADEAGAAARSLPPLELTEKQKELRDILVKFEPFNTFNENLLADIARVSWLESYEAKQPIVFEGDVRDLGMLPVSGRIAMLKVSSNGKELVVELLPPGDPFGLFAALYSSNRSNTLIAQIATEIVWIPKRMLQLMTEQHPELTQRLIRQVFDRLRDSHNLSRSLAHDSVEARVASTLVMLIPRFCEPEKIDDRQVPSIHMTRLELAEMIGSTSETVIRVTKAMEREGILNLTQSGVIRILEEKRLREISGMESS